MSTWRLRHPVRAVQYDHPVNAQAVYDLVNLNGGASFATDRGFLRCWNVVKLGAVEVADTDWVVAVGPEILVVSDASFREWFEKEEVDS